MRVECRLFKSFIYKKTLCLYLQYHIPLIMSIKCYLSAVAFVASLCHALPVAPTLPFFVGVNYAGLEFGINQYGYSYSPWIEPGYEQIDHFASQNVNLFRLPFGWNYAQPALHGSLDWSYLDVVDRYVKAILKRNAYVVLDLVSLNVFKNWVGLNFT